ncbi:hypothetical protein OG225_40390 (plasmid) [Nocardia sp. NBC_01377]|uniref:hypothetical protein n=1 Tax=Nocardia sp. NBC_01377 TaxID=2903595 RepID=UPI002F909DA3
MSWLPTVLDHGAVLAQVKNYTPEQPPGSAGLEKLMRYLAWIVLLSGVAAIMFAGGKFAWEKWQGGMLESPKMVLGALIGGILATSAGTIMNGIVS